MELRKLLAAPDPVPAVRLMAEDGVLAVVLPEARGIDRLAALVPLEREADPARRLAALAAWDAAGAQAVARRLKLTARERDRLAAIAAPPVAVELGADTRAQRRAMHRLGLPLYRDLVLLEAAAQGQGERAADLLAAAETAAPPRFPLRGRDVTAHGVAAGPAVGELLAEIEAWWEAGDFAADRKSCLVELVRRIEVRHG